METERPITKPNDNLFAAERAAAPATTPEPPLAAASDAVAAGPGAWPALLALSSNRILLVDDNPAIHEDFRKVLSARRAAQVDLLQAEAALFGGAPETSLEPNFELDSAHQGQEALAKVQQALAAGRPYAMAFVDVRMPPGWDGIETVSRIWAICPELQVVICTAYSDYSWEEMIRKLGSSDNLVILKKPFDNVEVQQLACALTRKWELNRQAHLRLEEMSDIVSRRTCELEVANRELRREIQERIQTERQLRHAQKMEAIGQLAAGVAHDFNNILTVVHGHASMLMMRLGEQGGHVKSLSEIRSAAERAANLVRQLLTFSHKQILQFRNVDLNEVVCSVSGMLRQLVGEHIEVVADCAGGLAPVFADRGMIEQVIVNLTVNARDAMPRGGRILIQSYGTEVTAEAAHGDPEARPGQFVCLSVSDRGCGMDAQALSHLFEPFYTTKETGKGTGLGLATVYGIVRQHQGWIDVESEVNAGSTFRIYFPVSRQASTKPSESAEPAARRGGNETILIAEDETALRQTVAEVLQIQGYHVLTAASGPEALRIWHGEPCRIDLLLTDLVMPGGMTGTELAQDLRKANPNLKVVFTTGYSPGSAAARDLLQEGVNFIPKPYSPNKLGDLVRKCLDSSRA